MRATEAYGELLRVGEPVVTTREAAAQWRAKPRAASQRLRALEDAGLVHRLRRGLWSLRSDIDPFALAHHLTAPFPAYVSLWSALHHHGLIEQIPSRIGVVSIDRPRTIATSRGTFEVHHLAPELFGGYEGSNEAGFVAVPEKAIFDFVYIRAAAGSKAFFPDLTLPSDFDPAPLVEWSERITSARLQTLVSGRLAEVLGKASRE